MRPSKPGQKTVFAESAYTPSATPLPLPILPTPASAFFTGGHVGSGESRCFIPKLSRRVFVCSIPHAAWIILVLLLPSLLFLNHSDLRTDSFRPTTLQPRRLFTRAWSHFLSTDSFRTSTRHTSSKDHRPLTRADIRSPPRARRKGKRDSVPSLTILYFSRLSFSRHPSSKIIPIVNELTLFRSPRCLLCSRCRSLPLIDA
jgi:hypothetical protein